MENVPVWLYDETKFSGVDFTRVEEVAAYDSLHEKVRDYAREAGEIIRRLSLDSGSTVIDLGSGTGAFALHAADTCRTIYAVDVSGVMLEYCRMKAEKKGHHQYRVLSQRAAHV